MGFDIPNLHIDESSPEGRDASVECRKIPYLEDHRVLTFTSVTVREVMRGLHHKAAHARIAREDWVFAQNREIVPQR